MSREEYEQSRGWEEDVYRGAGDPDASDPPYTKPEDDNAIFTA